MNYSHNLNYNQNLGAIAMNKNQWITHKLLSEQAKPFVVISPGMSKKKLPTRDNTLLFRIVMASAIIIALYGLVGN